MDILDLVSMQGPQVSLEEDKSVCMKTMVIKSMFLPAAKQITEDSK